jgi:hypothetical protein
MTTHNEWVQAALDAAVEQLGAVEITDPPTLDYLADVLSHPGATIVATSASSTRK